MSEATGPEHESTAKPEGDKPEADKPAIGTALAPAAETPSGIDPFLARADETPEPAPRPLYAKALDYSAHAAMIVGLVGFAWTVSEHVVRRQASEPAKSTKLVEAAPPAVKPVEPAQPDELGELRKTNQKMAGEIRNLHASLEALRTTVVRERSSGGDDVRSLSASLDSMRSSLASVKSEHAAALAQLSGKVEKLQREEHAQTAAVDRVPARSERTVDTTATASIPTPATAKSAPTPVVRAVPTPPTKPTALASVEPPARDVGRPEPSRSDKSSADVAASAPDESKPQVLQGWVVRDVYQGVALIEGRRGQMEVVPGVSIPGAGVVKSIERRGAGWTVTTTKGQVAYAAQAREYRRGQGPMRDYYGPSRRWDY